MKVREILWAMLATVAVSASYAGDPIEIGAGRVVLKFASDGRPKSFKADNKELLNEQDPGPGFEIKGLAFNYGRPTAFSFTALINPVIALGTGTMQITGTIPSESYIWYTGGAKLSVYDLNWKKISELPVVKKNFLAPKGKLEIRVESKGPEPAPWLECQFFVKDTPMVVEERKD